MSSESKGSLVNDLLPRWVEFSRLGNAKEVKDAVTRFFGEESATAGDFQRAFDVDLNAYNNFYLETGVADAPIGPFLGGRISPILVLKRSRSGKSFTVHIIKHKGIVHENLRQAWIERIEWEAHVDDTFAEELNRQAALHAEQKKDGKD